MSYRGIIIEESLDDPSILKDLTILETKVEPIIPEHKTPWLKQWTLHTVEISEERAEEVANKLAESLENEHNWYADFKNDLYHYVIFKNKVFRVDKSKPDEYEAVVDYGLSLGIPDYQLDFSPDIKEWER